MAKHDHDEEMLLRSASLRGVGAMAARQSPQQEIDALRAELREQLRLSRQGIGHVLDTLSDGFAILDRDWGISYINPRAIDLIRPVRDGGEPVAGKNLWQEFPALRGTVLETQYRRAMERQESVGFELYYLPLERWLEVRAYPCCDGLSSYLHDITERKAGELALRDNAQRLRVAMAAGKLGDWSWDAASDRVTLGPRAAELFDLPAAAPASWAALIERLLEEDRESARNAFLQAQAAHTEYNIECRIRRPDGAECWLSIVGQGNYGADGALQGMAGMARDITQRKTAEDGLRQSEQELRALANSIPQLAWIANFDGAMTWYNERWYEYTGANPEQAIGGGWHTVYEPSCLAQMLKRWEQSLRSGQPFEMEFPIRGADGQFRWFLTRANPVRDGAGRLLRWFGTSTDVDQVKRVQEALRDETNILELLNSTGTALAGTLDLRALLQEVSDAATRISGARFGAFFYHAGNGQAGQAGEAGAPTLYTLSGPDAAAFKRLGAPRAGALSGPGAASHGALRIDDLLAEPGAADVAPHWDDAAGQPPPLRSCLALPVLARSGALIGSLFLGHSQPGMFSARSERIVGGIVAQAAVAIDNTRMYEAAQQAAEERKALLDSERSARTEAERTNQMKDEFLATLSHELRTPLSAILGWAQVLRRGTRDQADLHRGLQSIERNARAQAQLIEDLLDMSRITSGKVLLEMQTIMPATIIDAAIEALRPAAEAKNIRLEIDVDPAAGAIAGDPNRLQQVIWNLLSNALKFTPKDGAVRIAVRAADDHVDITLSDSGIGIKPEFLAHVFERFRQADASTTRKHGGLGLGLAIVKYLVEQHGGTVRASSAGEGLGASFTVQLPLAAAHNGTPRQLNNYAPPVAPPASDMALLDLSHLKVLVVDDEADARELIERILSDCHAEVFTAADAPQALQLVLNERPDVLVSDIGMPEVDGFDLLGMVRALGAERGGALPAIALTAFARSQDRQRALEIGFQAHVSKPVEPSQLIAAVATVGAHVRS